MTMTGFKFGQKAEPEAGENVKKFEDAFRKTFLGDPSVKKMKEDISLKEAQNSELEDEISRLRYML